MAKFAEGTTVPVEKSQQEIGATLVRYGASSYATAWDNGRAMIAFGIEDRRFRMVLELVSADDPALARTAGGRVRDKAARAAAADAENRRRWRALALGVKAKLEAVATGIETLDEAFLAHILLGDGTTVAEHVKPAIAHAYATGEIRPFIPPPALPQGKD